MVRLCSAGARQKCIWVSHIDEFPDNINRAEPTGTTSFSFDDFNRSHAGFEPDRTPYGCPGAARPIGQPPCSDIRLPSHYI